jgi:hypothetical protein
MEPEIDRALMETFVGSTFGLHPTEGEGSASARLDVCEALPATPDAPREDPFRLVFTTEPGIVPEEGLYMVTGNGLIDELVLMVPIGPDAEGRHQLEAIFD